MDAGNGGQASSGVRPGEPGADDLRGLGAPGSNGSCRLGRPVPPPYRIAGRRLSPTNPGRHRVTEEFCEVMDVRENDTVRESARRAEKRLTAGVYGEGALDEVTVPPTDVERVIQDEDPDDPADAPTDPNVLRDGGPTRGQGAVTTTGGSAGPASVRRVARQPERHPGKVAPTTTGDGTTGGMSTPTGGSTSDQSSSATQVGNFTNE
jgi:hypothetical protein